MFVSMKWLVRVVNELETFPQEQCKLQLSYRVIILLWNRGLIGLVFINGTHPDTPFPHILSQTSVRFMCSAPNHKHQVTNCRALVLPVVQAGISIHSQVCLLQHNTIRALHCCLTSDLRCFLKQLTALDSLRNKLPKQSRPDPRLHVTVGRQMIPTIKCKRHSPAPTQVSGDVMGFPGGMYCVPKKGDVLFVHGQLTLVIMRKKKHSKGTIL